MDLASITALIGLILNLAAKAKAAGFSGLNPLPYVEAIAHVAEVGFAKVRGIVAGTGPDFAAMTPEEIHAYFLPKTVAELEAEARAEVAGG